MKRLASELKIGDTLPKVGSIVKIRKVTMAYKELLAFDCDANGPRPVYFKPTESVETLCCNGASMDCPIHGDGN